MTDHRELADQLAQAIDNTRFRYRRRMLTGRRLADNSVSLADAPVGKVWVRGTDQSREQTAVWGYASSINVPVIIDRGFDGEYEVVGVNYTQGVPVFGDAIHGVTASPAADDLTSRSIAGIGFKPGRLRVAAQGGMFVTAENFYHSGGYWDGSLPTTDLDLTSHIPGLSNTARWVLVCLDPSTNTLSAVDGAVEVSLSGVLLETTIQDIAIPAGVYPIGAISLVYGMTAISASDPRIVDVRWHLDHVADSATGSLPAFGAGVTKTLSSDIASAGADRHLVLAAESGTADNCIEVSGLSVGDEAWLFADTGDTITLKHNDAGATDKFIFYNAADIVLSGNIGLHIFKTATGVVVNSVDKDSGGGSGWTQGARAYNNASQTVADSTVAPLALNSERYDTDSCHDNVTNNSRLTCQTTGIYTITGTIGWDSNSSGERSTIIRLNGTTFITRQRTNSAGASLVQNVTTTYSLTSGDYVELCAYQTSGGTRTVAGNDNESAEFSMQRTG